MQSEDMIEATLASLDCYNNLRQTLDAETLTTTLRAPDTRANETNASTKQRYLSLGFSRK